MFAWIDRRSQEEKDEEIRVTEQLLAISEEELKGLNIEETPAQRQERERGIRSRVINETAGAIRSARSEESRTAEEAIGVAVDRVVLARMINERASAKQTELEEKEEGLKNGIFQREKNLNRKSGMERRAAVQALNDKKRELEEVNRELKEAKTKASSASKEVSKAEDGLSLVGLTVEKAAEKINEKEEFYKDSKDVDAEFQAKSTEFPSKVSAFKAAKAKVATMESVSLQTEGMKGIYEKARAIASKPENPTSDTGDQSEAGTENSTSDTGDQSEAGTENSTSDTGDQSEAGTENPTSDTPEGTPLPTPKPEELRVEVKEGNRIYVENNKKIKMERRTVAISDISEIRSIVVRGREVFLHEYEKNKEGEIEIRGYGEYGILPKLKSNNERVLARLYDRVLEGRERKEEGEVEGKGVGEDKGSQLFEKIGHLSVAEAYAYVSKEVRGLSLIPNIVMSVGSEEERKYVYKNMGERGEGEENKIWIEGINEVKNYGEDENSVGKYSDNKVGTIIGYGREVGEGKYVGMYMKGSKHEIKQGAGNSGEVVNVGLGISGKYENKVEIKWLTYVGMNKCKTEIGWDEGNGKGEFSMGEVGIDVEGGLKIRSELIGIVKPYIGIGARKSSYDKTEEKGKLVDMKIEGGSYERCVGRIGVEGIREISKRVEIVGRVEYERVIKGEVAGVKVEGVSGKVLGVREGKDKVGVNVEGRYKIRKDLGVSGGLNGYKAEGYNEVGVNVGGWFKF